MDSHARFPNRRTLITLTVAALLVVVGLMSAISAPGAPPRSNKADAYGGPLPTKPTNPKGVSECNKYYGPSNNLADARECRAKAQHNAALKKCNKKKAAAKTKCRKAANKKYKKDMAKVAAQRKAEKACTDKYSSDYNGLNPEDPDYDAKSQAISEEFNTCMKKARGD